MRSLQRWCQRGLQPEIEAALTPQQRVKLAGARQMRAALSSPRRGEREQRRARVAAEVISQRGVQGETEAALTPQLGVQRKGAQEVEALVVQREMEAALTPQRGVQRKQTREEEAALTSLLVVQR